MLLLLTKYLIRYKRVSIPHIGTFELIQQPPQLDIADKLFKPPFFVTRYLSQDAVPEHQVHFFAASTTEEKEALRAELVSFGQRLQTEVKKGPFQWNGFGILRYDANALVFEPQYIQMEALQPVTANKVFRPNLAHSVLVGDRHMSSHDMKRSNLWGGKRSNAMLAGWIILILALLAIAAILYLGNFEPSAAGTHSINMGN